MVLAAFTIITLSQSCKKKLTDEKIAEAATAAVAGLKDMKDGKVTVKDGVATVTGMCKDAACMEECKKAVAAVKGVKSVEMQCQMQPASVTASAADPKLMQQVKDGLKDFPELTVGSEGAKITVSGTTKKGNKVKIGQIIAATKIAVDLSKLMEK
jgi:osmotically-inducible protein OsmY